MIAAELDARLAAPFPFLEPARIYRLQRLAARGNTRAQAMLAEHALTGRGGVRRDAAGAIARLKDLAEQGEPYALVLLGEARRRGHWFMPADLQAARDCFRRAADGGEIEGEACLHGIDIWETPNAAVLERLRYLVQKGSARACVIMGEALQRGFSDILVPDAEEAVRLYVEADRRGSPFGALLISDLYGAGHGVEQDLERAHAWLKRAAEGGSILALYEIGFELCQSDSPRYDRYEGIRYLELAADLGHNTALYLRANAHDLAQGGPRDQAAAARRFRQLADLDFRMDSSGWVRALNLIGRHKDALKVARHVVRSSSDPKDVSDCHFQIGLMNELGAGTPMNSQAAWRSYQRAVRGGSLSALFAQALMMARGDIAADVALMRSALEIGTLKQINARRWSYFGEAGIRHLSQGVSTLLQAEEAQVSKDQLYELWEALEVLRSDEEIRRVLFEIANRGVEEGDLRLTTNKAWHLEYGVGCTLDQAAAARLNRWAAMRGHPPAMSNMGIYYSQGIGVTPSLRRSIKWVRRAAEAGHWGACFQLGWVYENGRGVRRNKVEALRWYEKAIELSDGRAMINTAMLLSLHRDIPHDFPRALDLLHKARTLGWSEATSMIGYMYRKGLGVPKDAAQASRWFLRAAEQNQPNALAHLAQLHWSGRGVLRDRERAWEYMRRAADMGLASASLNIAEWERKEAKRAAAADLAAHGGAGSRVTDRAGDLCTA